MWQASDPGGVTCLHGRCKVSGQVEGGLGKVGLEAGGEGLSSEGGGLSVSAVLASLY